jgi:hypothetical protein
LLNSRMAELLDNARLVAQLCQLERRTARSGKDSIDHVPGGHDDVCNAVAGALVLAGAGAQGVCGMDLKPVIARLASMGPWNQRSSAVGRRRLESIVGERRLAQIQAARRF